MEKLFKVHLFFLIFCLSYGQFGYSQEKTAKSTNDAYRILKAGKQYKRSPFYQWLMGKNYRREWTANVKVPILLLDTAMGGLIAYKAGGGHQTKSLHVKTNDGKEYTLRSVDKKLGKVLPEILHNTFLEDIVNDEVSMSHPYGAASVPLMAERAGIYHTYPQYVYLPKQPLLDTFNKDFGDNLYLFEQRLSGDWKEAPNLGHFEKFIDTNELLDSLLKDNRYEVDQELFAKSRLFDMLIGDWDRHEDQWEWGLLENNERKKVYRPVPQDRDQAYFKFDGVLLKTLISAAGLKYFQAFNYRIPDVRSFNYEERNLDRFFTNKLTLTDWQRLSNSLQKSLSDKVIETAINQIPPEIADISAREIIAKLKSRRDHLTEYATSYYEFIAKEVEIVGSTRDEYFEVSRLNDNETAVRVYRKTKGEKENYPFYSRTFKTGETREVRIFGLSGSDNFNIEGSVTKGINIRIIGGDKKDTISDRSSVNKGKTKTDIYDSGDNSFITSKESKLHISEDTSRYSFRYSNYLYDKKKISPAAFYNLEDRLYVGLNAEFIHHKWRRPPFAYMHRVGINYSISQHAMSVTYDGLIPKAVSGWDLSFKANYDAIRWTKFFGLGNETPLRTNYNDFYRMRSEEWFLSAGISRHFKHYVLDFKGFFQSVSVLNDRDRFVSKTFIPAYSPDLAITNFTGARVNYTYDYVNDSVVPTKGITFLAKNSYFNNISRSNGDFTKHSASLQLYLPLTPKLSIHINTAGLTVTGNPMFYQNVSIGGPESLRGYRMDRFWGRSAFYDANELRYITNVKSHVYNGKVGLLALFDEGRVWVPGEKSDYWHSAYGAGVLLVPFNKLLIVLTYAKSSEMKLFQLRVGRTF